MRISSVRFAVCVWLTSGVWAGCSASAAEPASQEDSALQTSSGTPRAALDLRAPQIGDVFSKATIESVLSAARPDIKEAARTRAPAPFTTSVPGGVFLPSRVSSEVLRALSRTEPEVLANTPPDVNDPYRPVVLPAGALAASSDTLILLEDERVLPRSIERCAVGSPRDLCLKR